MEADVSATLFTIAIAALTVVSVVHALASTMLREIDMDRLRRETLRLHAEHQKRLAELRNGRVETVEIIEDEDAAAA